MKFLIYSVNYSPEPTGIGKYSGEMATWLADRGHEVRVVCAPPYYPNWEVPREYAGLRYRTEWLAGVKVHRAPLWVPSHPGGIARVVHLLSFALTSFPLMVKQLFWRPDVVLTVAPALVCAPAGLLVAMASRALSWIHIQDFEVDVAFQMGLLKGRAAKAAVQSLERWLMSSFDVASSISEKMIQKMKLKGVNESNTCFFPNWVDITNINPETAIRQTYRSQLGIKDDQVVALFSGTLGNKQGLMVLPAVARLLKNRTDIVFVVCGDGVMHQSIKEASADLPNFKMIPLQPVERLNDLLGAADIHLLPQSPEAEDLVLPSKLSGMLASGKPVVATCRADTEIASLVRRCGAVVPPEDSEQLSQAIIALADAPDRRNQLGMESRRVAIQRFAMTNILTDFENACLAKRSKVAAARQ